MLRIAHSIHRRLELQRFDGAQQELAEFLEELAIASRKLRTLFDARVRAKGLTLARELLNIPVQD